MNIPHHISIEIFHVFHVVLYLSSICGAIISDSFLGCFATMVYFNIIYVVSAFVLVISAFPFPAISIAFTSIGLFLMAFAVGGIQPVKIAIGADQYKLPEQYKQMQFYFSLQYISVNASSLIAMFLTPVLREKFSCFGYIECYAFAFGVPSIAICVGSCK